MINNVVLVGRMTREVDLRYTGNGTAVGTFNLAAQRNFTNQQGERETDFINCVIWKKAAENLANFTRKGSLVGVEGRIQTRNYENAQGQRVYVTEILVEQFALLESKEVTEARPRENAQAGNQSYNTRQGNLDAAVSNINKPNAFNDPFMQNSEVIDIADADLPF